MNIKIKHFISLLLILLPGFIYSQNQNELRINEILVTNISDYEDEFGEKQGWIEIFNKSYNTVNIAGCYLSNDPNNLRMYKIPSNDITTKLAPRQYLIVFADNKPTRGTYHINFILKDSKELILTGSDGRTIIDRITIPHSILDSNISYGRIEDGKGDIEGTIGWGVLTHSTPKSSNITITKESASSILKRVDPFGIIMSLTAIPIVFIALILLYLFFKYLGKNAIKKARKRLEFTKESVSKSYTNELDSDAEQLAAISLALHMHISEMEAHDYEHTILTRTEIPKRSYSPWSSKIYTIRETPVKNKRR